jgi:hypothetical protein
MITSKEKKRLQKLGGVARVAGVGRGGLGLSATVVSGLAELRLKRKKNQDFFSTVLPNQVNSTDFL